MKKNLSSFFSPESVAVIGASSNPNKLSHGILRNLIQYGFKGSVYPINLRSKEILGMQCYADISQVPGTVELAVIIIPVAKTLEAVEACGKKGVKAVIIISGGFKEVGESGRDLEQQILKVAHRYDMRIVGPNCVGTMDLYSGLNTTFIHGVPDKGGIGFISQSGAVCGAVVDYIKGKGVGFSYFVSMGNELDVNETDMIEFLADDPNTRVIAAYVEAIEDGGRFMKVAREVSRKKPIVMLKAGRTQAGARAVSSHTGSIAGSNTAYEMALKQSGVIAVSTAAELFDVAMALDFQPLPKGKRVALVTNSGGPAALASDSLAENGFSLAHLSEGTIERLKTKLNPSAQVGNPVDMLGGAMPHEYSLALGEVLKDEQVDVAIAILVPQALVDPNEVAAAICERAKESDKTVIACLMGDASIGDARKLLHENHVPMYVFPGTIGKILGAMQAQTDWFAKEAAEIEVYSSADKPAVEQILQEQAGQAGIGELHARAMFEAYQIPVIAGELAKDAAQAGEIAERFGSPCVLKIVSPDILHKSDAKGIKLNVVGAEEAQAAYEEILINAKDYKPEAVIEGVLVEQMAGKGHEVIIGMRRDPTFGPLMMFGFGGIYVELFKDVGFRIAPMTREEAYEMVEQTKAGTILKGYRKSVEADIDGVVDCILKLSQMAVDFPGIEEIEINPLLVLPKGQGVLALDGRAILKEEKN